MNENGKVHVTGDGSRLDVWRRTKTEPDRTIALFELRYLPDTSEVVLLKSSSAAGEPEAVYSEILS